MENKSLIFSINLPNYLREIEVSKAQRAKHYFWDGKTIRAKGKKLLKKYIMDSKEVKDRIILSNSVTIKDLRPRYSIGYYRKKKLVAVQNYHATIIDGFTNIGDALFINSTSVIEDALVLSECENFLVDQFLEKVIANETQAGKPRRTIIKGQDMYSGVLNEFTRAKIVNELKASYYRRISSIGMFQEKLNFLREIISYPLYIHLEIHDTVRNVYDRSKKGEGIRWDVGNRAYPYIKTFVDFLVDGYKDIEPIIIDDDRLHVMGEGYTFHPIKEGGTPKLVFKIYKV